MRQEDIQPVAQEYRRYKVSYVAFINQQLKFSLFLSDRN
jgi:hypothetical protein